VDNTADFDSHITHDVCEMSGLQELTINTISDLRTWVDISTHLLTFLNINFRRREGWSCPILKVRERKTWEQLDFMNFSEKSAWLMRRRESGYGWEDGIGWVGAEQREERRKLESAQLFEQV